MGPSWPRLSVKLNASTFIIKNCLIWYCSSWAVVDNIFHHGRFVFFFVVYFEQSCTYLNLSIFSIARLTRWHKSRRAIRTPLTRFKSIWTVLYFQLQGWTSLYNFVPREPAFYNGFLVVESNFSRGKSNVFFFENFSRSPEGPDKGILVILNLTISLSDLLTQHKWVTWELKGWTEKKVYRMKKIQKPVDTV